jgi:hypothetical protein
MDMREPPEMPDVEDLPEDREEEKKAIYRWKPDFDSERSWNKCACFRACAMVGLLPSSSWCGMDCVGGN